MEPTPEQAAAINTRGTAIALDAGAGCGKTYVLTERLLAQLAPGEGGLDLSEIVAITFTDAAAREMRSRIREKCHARIESSPPEAAGAWMRLLRMLDTARVSTIHAFCANLVRSHAVELGLDPGTTVLDQPSADLLLSESTDEYLRAALDRRDLDVMRLAAEFGLSGMKTRIQPLRDVAGDAQLLEWASRPPDQIVAAWGRCFHERVLPLAWRDLASLPAIERVRAVIPQSTGAPETLSKLADLDALLERVQNQDIDDALLAELHALAMVRGVCGRQHDWPSPDAKKVYADNCKTIRDAIKKLPQWDPGETHRNAAVLGARLARVATGVMDAYQSAKTENAAIDFDDLLKLAARLLTEPQFAHVQQSVRSSIKLLLVDEFQDTDQLQAQIVKSLVGHAPEGVTLQTDRLFFVGDFKQSIYRFRGAEPRVFRGLQEATPERGRLTLSANFRSQPAVLGFVNAVFGPLFGDAYTPLTASRPPVGPEPAVRLLWTPAEEGRNVDALRRAEAKQIAAHLKQLLDDPTPRIAVRQGDQWVGRSVQPGDIAILFRALSDVQHYEEALRAAEVPYHLVGGHAFYSQQEVYDVLNLLRCVVSECDEVSLAGLLRSPFFALKDETLLLMARAAGSLNAAVQRRKPIPQLDREEQTRVDVARAVLAELRAMRGVAGAAAVLRRALDLTGYDAALLAEFLGERKRANLHKVLDQARSSDRARPGDIDAFVRQLSEFITRQPKEAVAATAEQTASVVRLMTVHNSKGLEFPVVVVADMDRQSRGEQAPAAFHPDLGPLVNPSRAESNAITGLRMHQKLESAEDREEQLRLFYVACTRAADLLVLSGAVGDLESPTGDWTQRLASRMDLQTGGLLEGDTPQFAECIDPVAEQALPQAAASRTPNLPKLLAKISVPHASLASGQVDRSVASIGIDPASLQRFSVSRISGKLHHRLAAVLPQREEDTPEHLDPLKFGTLVHAVMERVEFDAAADVAPWCEALAPLHLRRRWDEGAEQAQLLVRQFLQTDRCRLLATARQVHRELEFAMPWPLDAAEPTALLQGYIDCLYQDASGHWRLLDYKTNRVTAEAVQSAAAPYQLQMAVYALAIEQSMGLRPASLEVYFMRPGVGVEFPWDDAAVSAAASKINTAIEGAREEAVQHARRV